MSSALGKHGLQQGRRKIPIKQQCFLSLYWSRLRGKSLRNTLKPVVVQHSRGQTQKAEREALSSETGGRQGSGGSHATRAAPRLTLRQSAAAVGKAVLQRGSEELPAARRTTSHSSPASTTFLKGQWIGYWFDFLWRSWSSQEVASAPGKWAWLGSSGRPRAGRGSARSPARPAGRRPRTFAGEAPTFYVRKESLS